jgi:hypothetical protein
MMDTYFMNRDGRIANEFYIITDGDEGEIKRIETPEIFQITDHLKI